MSTSTFFLLPPSSCCFCNQVCNQVLQFDSILIAKGEIVWKSHRFLPLISDNQSCPALLLSPLHPCSARQIAFPWVTSLHLIDPASVLVCSEITIKITIDLWQCHTHCVYWVLVRLAPGIWCDVMLQLPGGEDHSYRNRIQLRKRGFTCSIWKCCCRNHQVRSSPYQANILKEVRYLQFGNLISGLTQNVIHNQKKILTKYRSSCPSVWTVYKTKERWVGETTEIQPRKRTSSHLRSCL